MNDRPTPMTTIRGVDPDLWHQVRVVALQRKLTAGEMLNQILRGWLAKPSGNTKRPRNAPEAVNDATFPAADSIERTLT